MDSDTERGTPVIWSSFHASRSNAVGQPEKGIEALLPLFHEKVATLEMIRLGLKLVKRIAEHLVVLVVDQLLYDLENKCSGLSLNYSGKTSLW